MMICTIRGQIVRVAACGLSHINIFSDPLPRSFLLHVSIQGAGTCCHASRIFMFESSDKLHIFRNKANLSVAFSIDNWQKVWHSVLWDISCSKHIMWYCTYILTWPHLCPHHFPNQHTALHLFIFIYIVCLHKWIIYIGIIATCRHSTCLSGIASASLCV